MYFYRARYYESAVAFLSRDRPGAVGLVMAPHSMSRPRNLRAAIVAPLFSPYAYVQLNPLDRIDPFGLQSQPSSVPGAGPSGPSSGNPGITATDRFLVLAEFMNAVATYGPVNAGLAAIAAADAHMAESEFRREGVAENALNALRHCIWLCELATFMGANDARSLGRDHENASRNNPEGNPDRTADLHNNEVGIWCSMGSATCAECCWSELRLGSLWRGGKPPESGNTTGPRPNGPPVTGGPPYTGEGRVPFGQTTRRCNPGPRGPLDGGGR